MTGDAFERIAFLGVEFDRCTLPQALDWVVGAARGQRFAYVVTPNVDHMVTFHDPGPAPWSAAYRAAVAGSDLCLNDSRILARLARLSRIDLPVVAGSDLTRELVARAEEKALSFALVGGAGKEARWLADTLPHARVTHFVPPMGVRDDPAAQMAIAEFVERERADCVLLAIGAPQSEIVAHAIARRGQARGVALCIGASVEFLTGSQTRAPAVMRAMGLEWLFRLASNPRRLWRRYLVRGPRIFAIWWKART